MSEKVKVGIIGAGAIAGAYCLAFKESTEAVLTGVADIDLDAAERMAADNDCKSYTDYELMVTEQGLDAAIVCVPPLYHPEITCKLLNMGVNVLCEKPLSIHVADARIMAEAAGRSGKLLTMGSKFRYVDDVRKAKALVDEGAIGSVILFENAFTSHVDMSKRWNAKKEISGGGVLIDNGTHSVDIMRYFLGPVEDVHVIEGLRSQGLDVDETVRIFARNRQGIMGTIDLSWSINKELPGYIHIYGTEGTIFVGWKESKIKKAGGEWEVFGSGYDKVQAFLSQIDNFARAIRGEEELLITAEDGIASVATVEAAYKALEASPWIRVENNALAESV